MKSIKPSNFLLWFILYCIAVVAYGFIVTSYFSKCDGGLGESGLFGDMFGAFNAFFTGLAFIGIWVTLLIQSQEKKKDELQKYSNCLTTSKNELEFYKSKFEQLSSEVSATVAAVQNKQRIVLPTYTFHPNFLEKQKIELSQFHFNSELIKDIGHCHFELCHIVSRLSLYLTEVRSINQQNAAVVLDNAMGFKRLLDDNTNTYRDTITKLLTEIEKINKQIA